MFTYLNISIFGKMLNIFITCYKRYFKIENFSIFHTNNWKISDPSIEQLRNFN